MQEAFIVSGARTPIGEDNRNVARMAVLLAGLPQTISGSTVNRLCASGTRIALTLLGRLERSEANRGLATMCVGVGQGSALLLERP